MLVALSIFTFSVFALSVAEVTNVAAQQRDQESTTDSANVDHNLLEMSTTLTWESIQLIREKHVDPPVTNQIILSGMRRLFPKQSRKMYSEIEKIRTKDDFKTVLKKALANYFKSNPEAAQQQLHQGQQTPSLQPTNPVNIANAFLFTVPGSPQVVTTYQSKINKQLSENRYVGVGIALQKVEQYTLISVAFRGGPAQKAGVIDGDRILEVDGVSMVDKPLGEVVMALRGPKDSEVDVVVSQPDKTERSYKMTRGVVPISSVKGVKEKGETDWDYAFADHPDTAYLEITDITGSTAAELRTAARQIERQGFKKLVIDFRNCFRAELHHMLMVADVLISSNKLGHWEDAKGKSLDLKLRPLNQLGDLAMTVIVSPSQMNEVKLLTSALVQHRDAKVVGQLNPRSAYIRGNPALPSGLGRVENVLVGKAFLAESGTSGLTSRARSPQAGRFRSGSQQIDSLIKEALSKTAPE